MMADKNDLPTAPGPHILPPEFFTTKSIRAAASIAHSAEMLPMACGKGFTVKAGAGKKDPNDPSSPVEEFEEGDLILAFGVGGFDLENDRVKKKDPTAEPFHEMLTRFAALVKDEEFQGEIGYSVNDGIHLIGRPVRAWATKNHAGVPDNIPCDLRRGCAAEVGNKFPYGIGMSPSARPNADGFLVRYGWSKGQTDPVSKFLEVTGYASLDEVPTYFRSAVLRDAKWVADGRKDNISLGMFGPGAIALGARWSPAKTPTSGQTILGIKSEKATVKVFEDPKARAALFRKAYELHLESVDLDCEDHSPINSEAAWLLWVSLGAGEFGVDDPYFQEATLDACRNNEDRKRIVKGNKADSWPTGYDPVEEAIRLHRCISIAEAAIQQVKHNSQVSDAIGKVEASGIVLMGTTKGKVAIDLSSIDRVLADGIQSVVLTSTALASHNLPGHPQVLMQELATILPLPRKGATWPECLQSAARYFTHRASDNRALELMPVGNGPYAVHPNSADGGIPISKGTLRLIVPVTAVPADILHKRWMDNADFRDLLEISRHFAPTDDEFNWYWSHEATSYQLPFLFSPTAAVLMGPTRAGKNTLVQAVNACFTQGTKVLTGDRAYAKFNSTIGGQHRIFFDECGKMKPSELEKVKAQMVARTIEIELKGKDTFPLRNVATTTMATNNRSLGFFEGGGDGRWQIFRNWDPVQFTGSKYEAICKRIGELVQLETLSGSTRYKDFIVALSSYLAHFDTSRMPTSTILNTEARNLALEDEQAEGQGGNRVSEFVQWLETKVRPDDLTPSGHLMFVPKALENMAGELGAPDIEGRYWDEKKVGEEYGPVLLQTATLLKILTKAKHSVGGEQFKWDKSNHNTLKSRLEEVRFGGERVVEIGKNGYYRGGHYSGDVNVFNDPHFGDARTRGLPQSHFHGKAHLRIDIATLRHHLCS